MSPLRLTAIAVLALSISGLLATGCAGQQAAAPESNSIQQPDKTMPQFIQIPANTSSSPADTQQGGSSVKIKGTGKLVFCSGTNDPGGALIYTCNINGSNWTKLSGNHKGADLFPSWSPDGSKIVFHSDRDGYYQIYIMNADGSNPVRLISSESEDTLPAWSPDGNKIAFTSNRSGGVDQIFVMNADGSAIKQVTSGSDDCAYPTWSPDGSRIAFMSRRDGNTDIYTINADGANLTRLTESPQIESYPAWSPDGKKIVYQSNATGNFDIWVMNPDGTDQKRITEAIYDNKYPAWSPDSSKVVFYSKRDCTNDNGEIYIMDADGKNQTRVTRSDCTDAGLASWR